MAESETEEKQKTDSESNGRAHLEVTAPRSSPRPSPRSSPRASPTFHRRKFDEPAKTDGKRWCHKLQLLSLTRRREKCNNGKRNESFI